MKLAIAENYKKNKMAKGGPTSQYDTYHETLGSVLREVENYASSKGYTVGEYFPPINHVAYGTTYKTTVDLLKDGKVVNSLVIAVYRMDSGRYELVMYPHKKMVKGGPAEDFRVDGYMTLSNSGGIEIELDNRGDGLRYRFNNNGNYTEPEETFIGFDEDGEAMFVDGDTVYHLSDFMRAYAKGCMMAKGGSAEEYRKGGNITSIEKRVAEVNEMIKKGNELGIEVIDESGTWQAPMKYKPIKYSNGILYIEYDELDLYKHNKGQGSIWKTEKLKVLKSEMSLRSYEPGAGQKEALSDIAKMYRKALNHYEKYGYYAKGGGVGDDQLNVVFSRQDVFERAKDFYENESAFYPSDVNDEFRTFVFDIENGEADVTEYYLEQELQETDLDGYYFEIADKMKKGGGVGSKKMAKKDLDKYKYYLSREEELSNAYDEAESEYGEDSEDAKDAWEDLGRHSKSMRAFEKDMIKQYGKDFYKQYDSYVDGKMKEGGRAYNLGLKVGSLLNKTKQLGRKGVDATKKAVRDKQKKIALNVIDDTKDKVSDNKRKMILKGAEEIVDSKYKKGGGVDKKKKTDFTISEYIQLEKQKLREHNAEAHEDDRLDWADWKSELTKEDTKEYGIYYNSRMLDSNGDRGVFEYIPTNKNYSEDDYAKGGPTKAQTKKVGKVMHEWKAGKLHSGSKKGPIVTDQKQAVAIALSEAGISKKEEGGQMMGWKHKTKK